MAFRITGRVQGVFFRRSAQEEAERLGLAGWVRNEPDGSVSAEAQGPEDKVAAFRDWCHRGPSHARVDAVETREIPPGGDAAFRVR